MFKVGDKVAKKDGSEWDLWKYRIVRVADEYGYIMLYGDSKIYCEEELKLYQEENRMEKTFREVIAIIREGEVWESSIKTITLIGDTIEIENKGFREFDKHALVLDIVDKKYKLQRKQYAFEEAFKSYEEGKEIESCVSYEKYSKVDDTDCYFNKFEDDWYESVNRMDMCEIRGKWYIND